MKKFVTILLSFTLLLGVCNNTYAGKQKRDVAKAVKAKMKSLNKGGWDVFATSRTLEEALTKHYENLNKDGIYEIFGTARSNNKNIGKEKMIMSACESYAQMSGSSIKGRMTDEMKSILTDTEMSELQDFYSAYENNVAATIKGEMKPSYSLIRESKQGGYEFETYYILDEAAASRARLKAFEAAAKESAVAQKHSAEISKFIQEGNPIEEEEE